MDKAKKKLVRDIVYKFAELSKITDTKMCDNLIEKLLNLDIDDSIENGVVVASVEDGSAASKAGLKKGDVIVKIDNTSTDDATHFRYLLYKYKVGDTITVKVRRGTGEKDIKITLTSAKKD